MKVIAIIQARMGSKRLPGKMLLPLLGRPVIAWTVERVNLARNVALTVVATSESEEDEPLAAWCRENGTAVFRGNEADVLDRYYQCALEHKASHVVRITGDCPFNDPEIIGGVVELCLADAEVEYATNGEPLTYPEGIFAEAMPLRTLETAWRESTLPSHREHVTPFIRFHPEKFKHAVMRSDPDLSHIRLTIDYPQDLVALEELAQELAGRHLLPDFELSDVLTILEERPDIERMLAVESRDLWRQEVARDEGRQID